MTFQWQTKANRNKWRRRKKKSTHSLYTSLVAICKLQVDNNGILCGLGRKLQYVREKNEHWTNGTAMNAIEQETFCFLVCVISVCVDVDTINIFFVLVMCETSIFARYIWAVGKRYGFNSPCNDDGGVHKFGFERRIVLKQNLLELKVVCVCISVHIQLHCKNGWVGAIHAHCTHTCPVYTLNYTTQYSLLLFFILMLDNFPL